MKIIITSTTVCDGSDVVAGQIVNAADAHAKILLQMDKAVKNSPQNREIHSDLIAKLDRIDREQKSRDEKLAKGKAKATKKAEAEAKKAADG